MSKTYRACKRSLVSTRCRAGHQLFFTRRGSTGRSILRSVIKLRACLVIAWDHMTEEAFNQQLVEILRKDITCNFIKSWNLTSGNYPIYRDLVCMVGVHFMGGELIKKSLTDIRGMDDIDLANMVLLHSQGFNFFGDNCEYPDLAALLPRSNEELTQVASKRSARVLCLDCNTMSLLEPLMVVVLYGETNRK
eukprot:scaffold174183_cov59-Attheya_sp.AAC.1